MSVDGETYRRGYALNEVAQRRCQIFKPARPIVDGDPTGAEWILAVDNCPFYHKESRGLDEVFAVGRQDQDLVFTTEVLYFPIDTDIDQDCWVREVTIRRDGKRARNFGRYFGIRGNPSWYDHTIEGMDEPYLIVEASMEARAPARIEALVQAMELPSSLYYNVSTNEGSMAAVL